MTLVTICVSIISVITSNRNAKKELERAKEDSIKNKEQFEIQLRKSEEVRMIHERPYLVFSGSKIQTKQDNNQTALIELVFKNKGRGGAYNIEPDYMCKAKLPDGAEKKLKRWEPIQDPIALVGESLKTEYALVGEKDLMNLMASLSINYNDASDRKYRQTFNLIVHKDGHVDIKNYPEPTLLDA